MKIKYPKSIISENLASKIKKVFESYEYIQNDFEVSLEHPNEENNGHFSTNIAMVGFRFLADKKKYKNPRVFAENILTKLDLDECEKIEVAGPGFINFYLKKEILSKEMVEVLTRKDNYGKITWGNDKKWVIEHTSPNPNKSMHLGHLRNNVLGMAISNIWEELGVEVIRDAIDNNRGIAICKLMWGYLKFGKKEGENTDIEYWVKHQDEWKTPESTNQRPDRFVDEYYVLGANDAKNPEIEKKVRQMVVLWEKEEPNTWKLWEKVLSYSHEGQKMTLDRLRSKWDKVWHEHEHYKSGKELVEKGLEKGIFKKTSDGAVLTNLEKDFGLTDTILIKNDGTSLYITQDLALTKLKKETFGASKLFWVIGSEQSLAMKQVFAVCDQLGIGRYKDFIHLAYGYMSILGQGKMSSRAGNVIYIDEIIDMAKKKIQNLKLNHKETGHSSSEAQNQNSKVKNEKQKMSDEMCEKLAVGAVKYSILKVGRMTDMAFDLEKSVSLEGDSGVYINYTYARGKSVLRKTQKELRIMPRRNGLLFEQNYELREKMSYEIESILGWLYRYPEVVFEAGMNYSPNLIAGFIFELSQRFNTFYNKEKIIGSGDEKFKLALTESVCQVIKNGMRVLGIELVERM